MLEQVSYPIGPIVTYFVTDVVGRCKKKVKHLGVHKHASARVDYVPTLCTHRPSLLPIGCARSAKACLSK